MKCELCKGTGVIKTRGSCYPKGGATRNPCSACNGRGSITPAGLTAPRVATYKKGKVQRITKMLENGIPNSRRIALAEAVNDNRLWAGVWYVRLAFPETPQLVVLDDALLELAAADELDMRAKATAVFKECLAENFERWQGPISSQSQWMEILARYAGERRDQFWSVADLAMIDYRLKTPRSIASKRYAEVSWTAGAAAPLAASVVDLWPSATQPSHTVHCVFCREVLISNLRRPRKSDYSVQTNPHTLTCGLYMMWKDEPVNNDLMKVMRG